MTTATEGFRLIRFNTAHQAIESGARNDTTGELGGGDEWTCFVKRLPGVHVYKPYRLAIYHHGQPFETVRIYRPGMWNRIGKNVIRRWQKGQRS